MKVTVLEGKTPDIAEENIRKLKQIFPDVFTEDKVDFEKLQQVLGDYVEDSNERYNFTWNGKGRALRLSQTPSLGTLRPCKEESKNWDTTQNLYIEGDNLEVLKLLQKSYHGKVKMIYIDPPYNTGKDFVYPDDFHDSLENYKKITGQVDSNGNRISTNTEASGRYHTNWLNMMYPRLRLARNLLSDVGVIFISIDDNEVHNLRKVCDEVFGEDNFIANIIHKNNSMKNQSKYIGVSTEYILVYCKDMATLSMKQQSWRANKKGASDISNMFNRLKVQGMHLSEIRENIMEMYSRPKYSHLSRWNKVDEKGIFMDSDLSRNNGPKDYTIVNPNTKKPCLIPNRGWGKSYEELLRLQTEDLIWYGNSNTPPRLKSYLSNETDSVFDNFLFADTASDKKEIDEIFGCQVFEFPKSLEVMRQIISLCVNKNDIILDFFSGSATTAHAVMQLNAEDGGNRKFIMVQLPEPTDEKSEAYKAGYKNICEIGKERIRRAGNQILELSLESLEKEGVIVKDEGKLSKTVSMAKINGFGGGSISSMREIAQDGTLFPTRSNETSSSVDTQQHSGGASEGKEGVYSISANSQGLEGGGGNTIIDQRVLRLLAKFGYRLSDDYLGGDIENDSDFDKESKLSALNSQLSLDIGFKVLKLDTSNIRKWQPDYDNLEQSLLDYTDNYVEGRTELDVVYEIMLKYGLDLTYPVDEFTIARKKVYSIGFGMLMICLDDNITTKVAKGILAKIKELSPESTRVVFKDNGFKTDSNKTNIKEILKCGGIEEFITL